MSKALAGALLSIGLSSGFAVHAQTGTAPAVEPSQHAARHHDGKRAFTKPSERVEARLAYLRTALKITDAQQAQWNAFAETLRNHARSADQRFQEFHAQREQGVRERPSAIVRLEREQQRHAASAARINELLTVQRPLYSALSAEQKAIADELLAPRRHGHHFGRGSHRMT